MIRHSLKGLRKALSSLERKYPGSVRIDKDGVVTLIGWKSEQFNNANDDKNYTDDIKCDTCRMCVSGVSAELPVRTIKGVQKQLLIVGVINPLPDAPQNATKGDKPCCNCRVCTKKTRSIYQEHKEPASNEQLIPVIESKFSDRIFHALSRLRFWKR